MLIQKLKIILNSNIFLIILILITICSIIYKLNNISSKYDINTKEIIGIVTRIKKDKEKTTLTIKSKENILGYYYDNLDINLGDKIKIIGELNKFKENTNFNLFNYRNYMLSKNAYYYMNIENIKIENKNSNVFYKIKSYLINRIQNIKGSPYLKLFILGDNSHLESNIKSSFSSNGISHLFSVSGMHISLLSGLILFILNKIKKSKINYIIVILFLLFYMFLTSFSPSVIRSTLLFIFLYINKLLQLKLSTFKILLIIMCFVIIVNPYIIYNTGFLFSYSISLYLIFFSKLINRYKNYLVKLLVTSFISFLVSLPILINNYFSINPMSIFSNLIFVPFVSFIIFPLSLLVMLIPFIDSLYEFIINVLENLSLFINNFKIEIILCHTNFLILILYYFIITLVLYKIYKKDYKYILLLVTLLFIHTNINSMSNNTFITSLDVGQGDSFLIHFPYNKGNILIDTGGSYNKNLSVDIINYLKSKSIKNIDYLILTHGDYDHMGEAINLVENFRVEKVIFNCGEFNKLEQDLIKVLDKKKIQYYSCISELNIGKDKLYFLQTKDCNEENENSSVIYTEIDNTKMLFMGDAGIEREKDILEKYNLTDIDILKVGHHGSNTSSSKEFIDSIKPKQCLISVGKNNRYGHPKDSVIDTLNNYCNIYRTDLNGSVEIKLKNNNYKIKTINE